MAQKTTVAVRFTQKILEGRRIGFVNELSRLIVFRLKEKRPPSPSEQFVRQWFRLPDDELVYCINVWGEHETHEVRKVISDLAGEIEQKQMPVVLDIINA
jgi:hypothetical protein